MTLAPKTVLALAAVLVAGSSSLAEAAPRGPTPAGSEVRTAVTSAPSPAPMPVVQKFRVGLSPRWVLSTDGRAQLVKRESLSGAKVAISQPYDKLVPGFGQSPQRPHYFIGQRGGEKYLVDAKTGMVLNGGTGYTHVETAEVHHLMRNLTRVVIGIDAKGNFHYHNLKRGGVVMESDIVQINGNSSGKTWDFFGRKHPIER